jgi:hypothetical protein
MIENLSRLVKEGWLGGLEIVNLEVSPGIAAELGVRTVPWFRIGNYIFDGAMPYDKLVEWARLAAGNSGQIDYVIYQLEHQQLAEVVQQVREHPSYLVELIPLIGDLDTPMAVRIGIGALIEELEQDPALEQAVPALERMTLSPEPQVRADACHYLGLCGDPAAIPAVRSLLDDDNAEVSEIAAETLAMLHDIHT